MIASGRVKNGMIEVTSGVRFAEGQEVVVTALEVNQGDPSTHGVLDIPVVHLSAVLRPDQDGDLLGEMLEGRR